MDGYRYDLEMQVLHTAKDDPGPMDGIGQAAVSILFDVNYSTAKLSWAQQKVIDKFFDNMNWGTVSGDF